MLFFLLLTVAALTSTISIAEVSVAFVADRFHIRRRYAVLIMLCPLFVFSSVCSLSLGPWSNVLIAGRTIFDFLDMTATNIMLPVGSIMLCIFVGWFAPRSLMTDQLAMGGSLRSRLYAPVCFIVRYVAPLLIAVVLISAFL